MADPRISVFANVQHLADAAAAMFVQKAVEAVRSRGRFVAALSGGGTPRAVYHLLAQAPYAAQMPWTQTHFFWGDARLVAPEDPESNFGEVKRILLDSVPIPPANLHRIHGGWPAYAAAAAYIQKLAEMADPGEEWPVFDLALMGMGADGHTASLFPNSPFDEAYPEPLAIVSADYAGRPAQRITLTPPVFNTARAVVFLVTGANKAATLAAVLGREHDPIRWPVQRIQPTGGDVAWWADRAVAGYEIGDASH